MNNRRVIPLIVGIGALIVAGGATLFALHPSSARETANAAVSVPIAPREAAPRPGRARVAATRLGGRRVATTRAGRRAALLPTRTSGGGQSDLIEDRVSEIAARYERGPQYQISVGASPIDVRATHPVNLYTPPHDPMYEIAGHIVDPPTSSEAGFIRWMLSHTPQKNIAFLKSKWQLASTAIRLGYLTHARVLAAFLLTPREWFVRSYNLRNAYENTSLPIGYGQTITDPETVIAMTNALDPKPHQRVLEIGTGSGYQSAFLSELSDYVYTVEIVRPLGEETNQIYLLHTPQMPQYANIHRRLADGYYGWAGFAPFDRIIVTTGIDHIPPVLLKELKPGGIMVIPVGAPTGQTILLVKKKIGPNGQIELTRSDLYPGYAKTVFVPFTSAGGGTHSSGG